MIKKLFPLMITFSSSFYPTFAAQDILITNHTKKEFTVTISNSSVCSNRLFKPFTAESISKIAAGNLLNICGINPEEREKNCINTLYASSNCTGAPVATIGFNTSRGIQFVRSSSDVYLFTGDSFHLEIKQAR